MKGEVVSFHPIFKNPIQIIRKSKNDHANRRLDFLFFCCMKNQKHCQIDLNRNWHLKRIQSWTRIRSTILSLHSEKCFREFHSFLNKDSPHELIGNKVVA